MYNKLTLQIQYTFIENSILYFLIGTKQACVSVEVSPVLLVVRCSLDDTQSK